MSTASPTVSAGNSGAPRGSLQKLLKELDACTEARVWALQFTTLAEAWKACKRGDWMVWLAAKKAGEPGWPTRQEVVLATCACAARALPLCRPKERKIARNTLAVVRKWARGEATIAEVKAAARDAYDAAARAVYDTEVGIYDAAASASGAATAAAAATAATAAYTAIATDYSTAIASAYAVTSVAAATAAAYAASLAASAKIYRRMLKVPSEEQR